MEILLLFSLCFFLIYLFKYLFPTPPFKKTKQWKHETKCRDIFENLFKKPFPSVRPHFLKRSNGYNLELDGFNSELLIAFEYQGIQHVKFTSKFHKTISDFKDQQQRDEEKKLMCLKANVKLIEIPHTVKFDELESYIITQVYMLQTINKFKI